MLDRPCHGGGRRPLVDPAASGSLLRHQAVRRISILPRRGAEHSEHAPEEVRRPRHDDARAVAGARRRFEYTLTQKGRDFFPTYLALKKWGDDWLAEPAGPQVVFRDRDSGRQIEYPALLSARGQPLQLEDVEIVAGSGAIPFNQKRFGGQPQGSSGAPRKTASRKKK